MLLKKKLPALSPVTVFKKQLNLWLWKACIINLYVGVTYFLSNTYFVISTIRIKSMAKNTTYVYTYTLDVIFYDITMTFSLLKPLNWWIETFQRDLWTYICVWCWWQSFIELFRFASFILYLEPDVGHSNYTSSLLENQLTWVL